MNPENGTETEVEKLTDEGIYKMVIETTANSSFHGRLEYPVDLTDKILITDLKVSIPAQQWTGEALTPTVTVKYKNKTVSDEFFTMEYTNKYQCRHSIRHTDSKERQ